MFHCGENNTGYESIWGRCCQKQISQAGISNYILQLAAGCNYLSLAEIPASGNKVLIWADNIVMIRGCMHINYHVYVIIIVQYAPNISIDHRLPQSTSTILRWWYRAGQHISVTMKGMGHGTQNIILDNEEHRIYSLPPYAVTLSIQDEPVI